ncbi:GNAT family N-acetyltransferase [Roseibium sp. HPY-6]|uniref:GNAT family N-acetyltransferase n=1 Tax=Roseibium sp. HPY-6 TaxID=3229852 RepID=UPI00338DE04E
MTTDITIRTAALKDKDTLTDLCMRSKQSNGYDDAFMALCTDELRVQDLWITDNDFWIAETPDGRVVGCIRLSVDSGIGELETCFVDPDWKGKGVGKRLFEALQKKAKAIDLKLIGLDADPFAEPFYTRMGFRTVGRSPSGSIPGRTLPRMELNLT